MRRKGLIVLVLVFVFSFISPNVSFSGGTEVNDRIKKEVSEIICRSYHIGYDYGIEECRALIEICAAGMLKREQCNKSGVCEDIIRIMGYACGIGYTDKLLGKYSLPEILKKVDEIFSE